MGSLGSRGKHWGGGPRAFSVKTRRLVKPREAHASTIFLIGTLPRFLYSEFGRISRISSRKESSCSDAPAEVVTMVRGGTAPEKWAENSSKESSPATSSSSGRTIVSSSSRVLSSVRWTRTGAASPSSSASFFRSFRARRCALSPSFLSLWYTCCRFTLHLIPFTAPAFSPSRPLAMVTRPLARRGSRCSAPRDGYAGAFAAGIRRGASGAHFVGTSLIMA